MSARSATPRDAAAVAALLGELAYPTSAAEARARIEQALSDPAACLLVGEHDGNVVGLLAAQSAPYFPNGSKLFRITALVVAEAHRGKGIGRALIQQAMTIAADKDCAAMELTTAEHRSGAHSFYERLGFKRTSVRYFRRL